MKIAKDNIDAIIPTLNLNYSLLSDGTMGKLIISDVDGVLTDSKINIGENGEMFKSFNMKDGYGIVKWEKDGNEFVIVTSRESRAVEIRASELGIEGVYQGVSNKKQKIKQIAKKKDCELKNIIYIGDDINDIEALQTVCKACCPADAVQEVRDMCSYISEKDGGEGAVRDIIDHLSQSEN